MRKAVILAGGTGSRMLPATANINKHLLPIYSHEGAIPMIYYPIFSLVKGGIKDILIISSREHCGKIIENLGDGKSFDANFTYKIQDTNNVPFGIASALKLAQGFTGIEPFAVVLGDNFFEDDFSFQFKNFNSARFDAGIFLKEVEDPNRFGVYYDNQIEEKPSNPKSNLAVTGLYLYTNTVYQVAENLKLSNRQELEITDINNHYCLKKSISINKVDGFWSDMGTPNSLISTQRFINKTTYSVSLKRS